MYGYAYSQYTAIAGHTHKQLSEYSYVYAGVEIEKKTRSSTAKNILKIRDYEQLV